MALKKAPEGKPEQQFEPSGNPIYESNPQNHYDMSTFHSKMAGKMADAEREAKGHRDRLQAEAPNAPGFQEANGNVVNQLHNAQMRNLMHSDMALKHYKMSGLTPKQANDEHIKQMALHHEMPHDAKPPFQDYALELAHNRANPGKK